MRQVLVAMVLGASLSLGCTAAAAAPARATVTRKAAHGRDCRAVYGGRAGSCKQIPCNTLLENRKIHTTPSLPGSISGTIT